MPVGLTVFNDANILQIDENSLNFGCVAQGTVTLTNAHPAQAGYESRPNQVRCADITVTGRQNPIIAIKASGPAGVLATTKSGTTVTFRIASIGTPTSNPTVDYFVFDTNPASPTGAQAGLEIRDASGRVIFHSNFGNMQVVGAVGSGLGNYNSFSDQSWPKDGKHYAIAGPASISVSMTEDHMTDGQIRTDWTYGFNGMMLRTMPSNTSRVDAVFTSPIIASGQDTSSGGFSPPTPSGELNSWGATGVCLVIDVTRFY
jgi:hypothetical protein